ncbi:MAG: hypothetical protein MZV63_60130 [Marinilabiliales bacterium]|nr:hypothetical protein [Marinilabiliales bacterium]
MLHGRRRAHPPSSMGKTLTVSPARTGEDGSALWSFTRMIAPSGAARCTASSSAWTDAAKRRARRRAAARGRGSAAAAATRRRGVSPCRGRSFQTPRSCS